MTKYYSTTAWRHHYENVSFSTTEMLVLLTHSFHFWTMGVRPEWFWYLSGEAKFWVRYDVMISNIHKFNSSTHGINNKPTLNKTVKLIHMVSSPWKMIPYHVPPESVQTWIKLFYRSVVLWNQNAFHVFEKRNFSPHRNSLFYLLRC